MSGDRNVTISQDAFGNAIVTGDNNLTFVLVGVEKVPDDLLAALKSGRLRPADVPSALPMPALTLAIAFGDDARMTWRIAARRATGGSIARDLAAPWRDDPALEPTLAAFWQLSRERIESPEDRVRLDTAAHRIGDALGRTLSEDEGAFLIGAARGDPPPPLLVIESDDDGILGLPWELIRLDGQFAVRDGRLDIARSVPAATASVLSPPAQPVSLLLNISAPEASGLDYERESYLIVRALHEHLGVVVNEMGEVEDLVEGLRRADPAPVGAHFSGHGGPGTLVFEDEFGEAKPTTIPDLLSEIRQRAPERLPRFFFLACCHGGDAPAPSGNRKGLPAAATALHRDGITQVVAYFGPVLDELSTRAERAFYSELAGGKRTRDAVRLARSEMSRTQTAIDRGHLRDASGISPGDPTAYAWAQIVLYQRGPDYPLGTKIEADRVAAIETTERRTERPYPNSRTRLLKAGFVGRRKEMHTLRRDLRQGRHLHVVQGAGGLGKSAFCTEALKLYSRLGWQPIALWCADVAGAADPVAGLLPQLDFAGGQLFGKAWESVLGAYEQAAGQDEGLRQSYWHLLFLLQSILAAGSQRLVLYLDNLESLQIGPADAESDNFASWRDLRCAALWRGLLELQREASGQLALLASTRYRHPDFGAVVPFLRLPADALWRMLLWFPSLRRLSEQGRSGLVERLAGHPRAVEYLDALIADSILSWESDHGAFVPGCLTPEHEQGQIIAPALPGLQTRLSENLLFDVLWDRVLDTPARELLVRAGVLRRPGDRGLLLALAGEGAVAAIARLVKTGLLTEIGERGTDGRWISTYEVHPTVYRLAERRSDRANDLRREGRRRAGEYLERVARTSPSWQDNIEGAYQLGQIDELDRAFDLIAPLVDWLQARSRIQDSLFFLGGIGDPASLGLDRAIKAYVMLGHAAETYGDLSGALSAYRAGLAIAERLAAADPSNAGWQRDLSVSQNKIGDVLAAQGRLDDALSAYRAGLAIRERLAAADPSNAGWQRDLSVSQNKIGDVLSAQGRLDDALSAYRAGLAISERLAAADPSNAGWQRDLSVSQNKIGDVLSAQGRLDDALSAYRAGLAIRERLAAADPSNAGWQRDLSVSQSNIGDVLSAQGRLDDALSAYRAGLAIAERLAAADPSNAGWQRDLSVGQSNIGDVLSAQGRLDDALSAYRAGLAIRERLAAADPSNAGWQRDLSVSQSNIGDVLSAQGRLDDALSAYRAGLAIRERLAAADPSNAGWQRDLSVSQSNIGDVLSAQGRLDDALSAYRAGLAIAERLAAADPSNAGWQRDLSVSQNKIGDVLSAQGRLDDALSAYRAGLAISERLAAADPSNAGWQRDLSVSQSNIGNVLSAQGRLDDALSAYRAGLAISERLAAADPSNAGWQRDLSVSQNKIGDVLSAQGRLDDALSAYRAGLAIAERLAAADPSNAGWQRDLFTAHVEFGLIEEKKQNPTAAASHYREAEQTIRRLTVLDPSNPQWQKDLTWIEERRAAVMHNPNTPD